MEVSVIIPTYNKCSRLEITLETLYGQLDYRDNYEVIIIDDGSNEETFKKLKKLRNKYGFILYSNTNKGRAYARNVGIEKSKYNTLIFIDDDVILSPDFIRYHLENQNKIPAIVHGTIKNFVYSYLFADPISGELFSHVDVSNFPTTYVDYLRENCKLLKTGTYKEIFRRSKTNKLESKITEIQNTKKQQMEWLFFTGGNISCPKAWLQDVGGFDVNFGTRWGAEDLELGYRLKKMGRTFVCCEKASCCHIDHFRSNSKKIHNESIKYFYGKHNDESIIELNNYLFQ